MGVDRATLTILFTDAVGSTALSTERGDALAGEILRHSDRLVGEAIAEHGGRRIKSLGDGSLCAFRGPRAAIGAAIDLQEAHDSWARESPDGSVAVRVGIHTGEVDESPDDLHGEAVSAAARICASADGGEILVSATARGAAGSGAGLRYAAPRALRLKGFAEPVEVAPVDRGPAPPAGSAHLEQRIRFCEVLGHRLAWAEVGSGPPLVIPAPWVGNVHGNWEDPQYRRFVQRLAAQHRVIRYDRPGTGLSDRELPDNPGLDHDVRILEGLLDELGIGTVSLFALSAGGCIALGFAARNPDAVSAMVLSGAYVNGSQVAPEPVRDSLISVIRASWGLGARMLSDIMIPGGTSEERELWAKYQRDSADPEAAAKLYELVYSYDASQAVERVTAPTLVLHRRDDTAVSFRLGRELAARLPNARLLPLEGMRHLPWQGETEPIVAETLRFLAEHRPAGDGLDRTAAEREGR